jgi:hypothetical protein
MVKKEKEKRKRAKMSAKRRPCRSGEGRTESSADALASKLWVGWGGQGDHGHGSRAGWACYVCPSSIPLEV